METWGNVSIQLGRSVFGEIKRTLGPSAQLMIMSMIIALVVGLPIGILSATRQDTWGDYAARIVAIGGLAVPTFWVAVMVILLPSYYLNWAPPIIYVSFFDDPGGNLYFYMLPSMVAGIPMMAEIMRITRNMLLEVLREDYIRTAYSKGLRERLVIYRHALKNAMIPGGHDGGDHRIVPARRPGGYREDLHRPGLGQVDVGRHRKQRLSHDTGRCSIPRHRGNRHELGRGPGVYLVGPEDPLCMRL